MTAKEFKYLGLSHLCELLFESGEITDYETLKEFAISKINSDDLNVASHICNALWEDTADYYIYDYSMGTLETPTAIKDKSDIAHLVED